MSSFLDVDSDRLLSAQQAARSRLLRERNRKHHWVGRLSSSPLATATAVSALALAEQHIDDDAHPGGTTDSGWWSGVMVRNELSELLIQSLGWLAERQNDDGGWGDTDQSVSNIATTMLVEAAFHLTGVPAKYTGMLDRARSYVDAQGGVAGLKARYGNDRTFAAPILTNYALAGLVPWKKVPALPFELACLPPRWFHRLRLPVVSYAIPALAAIGQARHYHAPSWNPLVRGVRSACRPRSLELIDNLQPESGGFLEATPLTSFVVMSLASVGQADHRVVRRGVEFLLAAVRGDGSWAIDTDLATWNTSLSLTALDWEVDNTDPVSEGPSEEAEATLDWLLACQSAEHHPYTQAAPGGWPWTNAPGGVPDADDTSAALLALAAWRRRWPRRRREEIVAHADRGLRWLCDLQNDDGGVPTFCRGWGTLPFDRSSTDITAHAVRAWHAWRGEAGNKARIDQAIERGLAYLVDQQHASGAWAPLWFGNQHHPEQQNFVYGTAKVLLMYEQLGRLDAPEARRAAEWLAGIQHADGGWGPAPWRRKTHAYRPETSEQPPVVSVEETALAIEALLPYAKINPKIAPHVAAGLDWLIERVETGSYIEPSPIGFYFAKLWYYERLYPQVFTVGALAKACCLAGLVPRAVTATV